MLTDRRMRAPRRIAFSSSAAGAHWSVAKVCRHLTRHTVELGTSRTHIAVVAHIGQHLSDGRRRRRRRAAKLMVASMHYCILLTYFNLKISCPCPWLSVSNWQLPAFVSRTALLIDDYTVCICLLHQYVYVYVLHFLRNKYIIIILHCRRRTAQ